MVSIHVHVIPSNVSRRFQRKIKMELGVDVQFHPEGRGWLCDVSEKPHDWVDPKTTWRNEIV
jgi:hypothetical protein